MKNLFLLAYNEEMIFVVVAYRRKLYRKLKFYMESISKT
jgi:hypothetical protein